MHFPLKIKRLWQKASPKLRKRIVLLMLFLITINLFTWSVGLLFAKVHPFFLGLMTLAYGLGLRHAVDADHIAAIDTTTRKLMADGKRPVAVGLFFSLGHATIVILLSLFVAFSATFIKHTLPALQHVGSLIGTSVSIFFLLMIGFINLITFLDIFKIFRCVIKGGSCKRKIENTHIHFSGFLNRVFKPAFKIVTNSWHMYFVGFLFGLGFDTASEVGLLSISAISVTTGISIWEILLLPLSFTAGMALIDSLDGMLMLITYGWAYVKPIRKLYYNLNITFVSVLIAFFIGGLEVLQLLESQFNFNSAFLKIITTFDISKLGYIIVSIFLLSWIVSLGVYKMKQYDRLG